MNEKLILRPYQQRFLDDIIGKMSKVEDVPQYRHILGYLPQGSGKSACIAYMALNAVIKGRTILILTHRKEVLEQNFKKMEMLNMDVQIINRSTRTIKKASCYVGMAQTISRRIEDKEEWTKWLETIDFVIGDEAHRQEIDAVVKNLNKNVFTVGLSATLLRSGNSVPQLGRLYDYIVKGVEAKELIELKYLVPSKNYIMQAPKLDDIEISQSTGDYVQEQLQNRFKKAERYCGVIKEYQRLTPNTKTLIFTTCSEHCIELCVAFNEAGVKAKYLLSNKYAKTDEQYSDDRDKLLKDFNNGEFDVLVNVFTLDTGFDCPSLETVIIDFSTNSYARFAQAVGRGSRPCDSKDHFNVLDFGDNISRFGIFERSDPPMSLWHNVKDGGGVMPTKECPKCHRLIPVMMKVCPYEDCGYIYPTDRSIYEAELTELLEEGDESLLTIEKWIAKKVLDGWSVPHILMTICIKNKGREKMAFDKAIVYLRTKDGKTMSPSYWYFFKKNILNKSKIKI
ncbi:MAG: DEAD/DEAH box helicase family protein [Muribaculaceae bacterium]